MFAQIKTNGADLIIIHIPHEGADKSLPMLARMLEENAVFVRQGYNDTKIIRPETTIILGHSLTLEGRNEDVLVIDPDSNSFLTDDWRPATPQVFTSNKKKVEQLEKELQSARIRLAALEDELKAATTADESAEA